MSLALASVLAVSVLAVSGALAAPLPLHTATQEASIRPQPTVVSDAAVLHSASSSDEERAAAARRLVGGTQPGARAAIEELLTEQPAREPEEAENRARAALLREIADEPSAPVWLVAPLGRLLTGAELPESERLGVVAALGSVRSRDALRVLIDTARSSTTNPGIRQSALAGLTRLSGRTQFGDDLNRWELWYGQVQWLPEAEWRRELAEGLAARADALAAVQQSTLARLLDAMNQQYLRLEDARERSAKLVQLLGDPQVEVRCFGLGLAQQEAANARPLEPSVGDASALLLADARPETRRLAAELLAILGRREHAPALAAALAKETDDRVAALLLRAAGRWPLPELTPVILKWLDGTGVTASAAGRGWSAPAERARAAVRLRELLGTDPDSIPPSGLRLLHVLGEDADRAAVLGLLRADQPTRRWAAATAMAQVPQGLDPLLAAAASDAALFPLAAQAVASFRANARGFAAMANLPAEDAPQRRERLLALAQSLTHAELLRAARATTDPSLCEAMLARLLREPLANQREQVVGMMLVGGSAGQASQTLKPDVVLGLLTLSDARVELGLPAGALVALDALGPAASNIDPDVINSRRVPVLIWLNRLEEAAALEVPASVWLDGLERSISLDHAAAVADRVEGRFGPSERLTSLRNRASLPKIP